MATKTVEQIKSTYEKVMKCKGKKEIVEKELATAKKNKETYEKQLTEIYGTKDFESAVQADVEAVEALLAQVEE